MARKPKAATTPARAHATGGGSDTIIDDASEVDESFAYWAEWVDAV